MIRRTAIAVLALLLCVLLWWIGPLIAIGIYRPLISPRVRVIVVMLVLCWALWPLISSFLAWLFRHVRSLREVAEKSTPRDRVTARFHDALRTLQLVGLANQRNAWQQIWYRLGRGYIAEKPWFLVVGPQGCGKTSLICESGESFLLAERYGVRQTVDVGPTQDCNWWLTQSAVYIDTCGEWLQLNGISNEAAGARDTLLRLIKRHRRIQGIDGIVLCLDARWLSTSTTKRKSVIDAMRVRLLDTATTFRSDLPVYFYISHLDQIAGGETFLAMLSDSVLQKGLGFSLNQAGAGETLSAQCEVLYRELLARVSQHVLELVHDAPDPESRKQLLLFTESLGALGIPLYSLLEQVFPQASVGYRCHLRQVWLGSAVALNASDSLYDEDGAGVHEVRPCGALYQPGLTYAWQERGVLRLASRGWLGVSKLVLYGQYVQVFLVLALLLSLLGVHYLWESDYIAFIGARFDETKRIVREAPGTNRSRDEVVSAYEQMGYMNVQLWGEVSPFFNPFIEHQLINNAAKKTYHRHLLQIFWPALEHYITDELQNAVADPNQDDYSTLKVYLMLGKAEHRSSEALIDWFMARWGQLVIHGDTDMNKEVFATHLREMFSLTDAPELKMNEDLLRLARLKAMDIPMQVRVVRRVEEKSLHAPIENISLAEAAGPNVSLMLRRKSRATVTDATHPGFYTRAAYHDVFLPKLDDAVSEVIDEESWVLRDSVKGDKNHDSLASAQKLADEAKKLYLTEYADHWDGFVHDVRVRPISGLEDAAILARQLSDPSSPLVNLIRFVVRETSLSGYSQGNSASWFDNKRNNIENQRLDILRDISGERSRSRLSPERAVDDRFEMLHRLGYQLHPTANDSYDPLTRVFEGLYNQLSTLSISLRAGQVVPDNDALKRLQLDASRLPEPVRSVIKDLLHVGEIQTVRQSRRNLGKGASFLASGLCNGSIGGRYPFFRNAKEEVGVDDFSRMFGPSGAMQTFFDEKLAAFVDADSQKWGTKPGAEGMVSKNTLKAFENAALIRETFFVNGEKLSFSMFLRPLSLTPTITEATLDVDGQVITYSHGFSQPTRVEWPGPKGGSYVRFIFKTGTGQIRVANFEGPWALFRMYDASSPMRIDGDRRELTLSMSAVAGALKLELRSTMKDFPLWSRGLTGFVCPKAI